MELLLIFFCNTITYRRCSPFIEIFFIFNLNEYNVTSPIPKTLAHYVRFRRKLDYVNRGAPERLIIAICVSNDSSKIPSLLPIIKYSKNETLISLASRLSVISYAMCKINYE